MRIGTIRLFQGYGPGRWEARTSAPKEKNTPGIRLGRNSMGEPELPQVPLGAEDLKLAGR
ncbi:MAG: hypothetical protein A2Y80_01310 [Deltaproteobacteria bacterium RBG_13_58_19]|nr:MAG: hypothetical protein A2Y80_01310 [Deltaproteobacteria bacterium RBG_13_58_19]